MYNRDGKTFKEKTYLNLKALEQLTNLIFFKDII